MNKSTTLPMAIENMQFDEFGRYEVTELIIDEELDLVSGGFTIGQINIGYCPPKSNVGYCQERPPPQPNKKCGEDGDEEG